MFLIGIIFFGVIIGSLTQLLQRASKDVRKAQLYREKMEHVDRWLRSRRFSNKLRVRLDFFHWFFQVFKLLRRGASSRDQLLTMTGIQSCRSS